MSLQFFDQAWSAGDGVDDDQQDETQQGRQIMTSRDGTIFLVDCGKEMFEPISLNMKKESDGDDDDDQTNITDDIKTPFQLVMKAAQTFYQSKIISNDKDLMGIILYGTEKSKNSFDFKHINILHELSQPSAERIIELETLSSEDKYLDLYKKEFGSVNLTYSYSLNEALWTCSNLFSNSPQRLTVKRIFIFTCNDQPHATNLILERQAKQRAKDLNDVGIQLELFPLLTKTIIKFDYRKFFQDMLMLADEDLELLEKKPFNKLDELLKRVLAKEHKKRAYCTVPFKFGMIGDSQMEMSVSVYNIVRPCPKPTKIKLDKKTNLETKIVTKHYLPETAEILMPSDIQYGLDIAGRRILFEQDEIKAIKKFDDEPGFRLLGFKQMSCLKPFHYVKPGHFIYPDEKYVEGSSCLFNALLKKCLDKQMFVLCQFTARRNTPPRMVALIPQKEEFDAKVPTDKIASNGFHVAYLPYADDIRSLPKFDPPRATQDQIQKFRQIIKALKFKYHKPDEFVDLTIPNIERMEDKAGQFVEDLKTLIFPVGYAGSKKLAAKRKADGDAANESKKSKMEDAAEIETAARNGSLQKLTVPIMKDYCRDKKIRTTGTRKQDLIDAINAHLSIAS
ncbi:unnamed protein product [Didymodactylos carnosus]|uniref:DNA helicase n=1 Tax=Didymodactylos carnosus TaxID=1234261 RepID=A0A8S2DMR6_9BILA|nr:unnamed protein product [Didymodactylos carnosus]CAF3774346.1 unnamed protein product [Didymodactylos carnosus]